MTGRVEGKITLITGAGCVGPGWGNGRAMAVRFAEEGAKIFAADLNLETVVEPVERIKTVGGTVKTHQCDMTSRSRNGAGLRGCLWPHRHFDQQRWRVGSGWPR